MPSLTPQYRNEEVTNDAMNEGLKTGAIALVPCVGALYVAMQNPKFVKVTNWQSRTAMVLMPSLFMFAFSAETRLTDRMKEVSKETEHAYATTIQWAEGGEHAKNKKVMMENQKGRLSIMNNNNNNNNNEQNIINSNKNESDDLQLKELYMKSIEESGINVVPGDTLQLHHRVANFVTENPFKLLSAIAIPSVLCIFYGRAGKQHLNTSMKLMHTRVFGQFTTISLLLGIMGFKELMDRNGGKYITEIDAQQRVEQMCNMRKQMQQKLHKKREQTLKFQEELRKAHEQDIQDLKLSKVLLVEDTTTTTKKEKMNG